MKNKELRDLRNIFLPTIIEGVRRGCSTAWYR